MQNLGPKTTILKEKLRGKLKFWEPCQKFAVVRCNSVENLQHLSENCNFLQRLPFLTQDAAANPCSRLRASI